jgi:hypothetical protein
VTYYRFKRYKGHSCRISLRAVSEQAIRSQSKAANVSATPQVDVSTDPPAVKPTMRSFGTMKASNGTHSAAAARSALIDEYELAVRRPYRDEVPVDGTDEDPNFATDASLTAVPSVTTNTQDGHFRVSGWLVRRVQL